MERNSKEHNIACRALLEQSKAQCMQRIVDRGLDYRSTLTQLKAEYNRDISALYSQIGKLSNQMNSLTPVAHLPPELLSAIFTVFSSIYWDNFRASANESHNNFYESDSSSDDSDSSAGIHFGASSEPDVIGYSHGAISQAEPPSHYHRPFPWQTLQCVCKRWYHIVQDTPALFTCIASNNGETVHAAIKKAGTRPLDILWVSSRGEDGLDHVLANLSRARSLVIALAPRVRVQLNTSGTTTVKAPQLTSIEYWLHEVPEYCTLTTLSQLRAPKLSSLRTNGGSLTLNKTFFRPTLTSLYMSDWTGPAWGSMATILEPLVNLHTLSLRFGRKGTHTHMRAKNITLPKLTYLVLYDEDTSTGLAQFMDHVTCPLLANIKCWSSTDSRRSTQLDPALTRALGTKMETTTLSASFIPRTVAFRNSWVSREGQEDYTILGVWTTEQDSYALGEKTKWEPMEGSFFAPRLRSVRELLTKALPMFNLAQVTILWIDACTEGAPLSSWRRFFRSTPNVRTLHIQDFRELASMLRVSPPDSPKPLVLPLLRILDLRCVNKQNMHTLKKSLVCVLQARQEYALGPTKLLDKLEISTSWCEKISEKDTQFLRDANIAKVVSSVHMR
ncbi:hypothetical protein EIP86_003170 [Pleurotus ostreatoroseus]|nr:hypothetical protein EIP86_003170 [Pleurotus ostreatoroseus]